MYANVGIRDPYEAQSDQWITCASNDILSTPQGITERMIEPGAKTARVAMAVQGRFHAFDLAAGLQALGAPTHVFTNYPGWAVRRFGFGGPSTSFAAHGLAVRLMNQMGAEARAEALLHRAFGWWLTKSVDPARFDVVHLWSGVAEEVLEAWQALPRRPLLALMRGSCHIHTQHQLLLEEERRAGLPLDRPSAWMQAREVREYAQADVICCLSRFAYNSFVAEGVPPGRLAITPLGVSAERFGASAGTMAERRRRIQAGERLRVLTVGTLSYQKGLWDYAQVVERMHGLCDFRFVGTIPLEGRATAHSLQNKMEFVARVSQEALTKHYEWGDVFLFPTIQDGFAAVLNQAAAGGLPILATANCSAPDFVEPGRTGWILPIRQPEAFCERLRWCHDHRSDLAQMVAESSQRKLNNWQEAARQFLEILKPNRA
jgi:glycosyltransferase involved in cell wall biosynthesis